MNLNSIFKTNEDRERAIASMTALSNDPNWKFLIDNILKPDIEETAMFILDTKFNDLQQENELKKRRDLWIMLTQLPGKLVDALKSHSETIENFDPYYMSGEELAKDAGKSK